MSSGHKLTIELNGGAWDPRPINAEPMTTLTSHPLSHCKTCPDRPTTSICNFQCLVTSRSHLLPRHKVGSSPLRRSRFPFATSQIRNPRSSRRSEITARNVSGIRLSPHSILNVSGCFRSTFSLNAFMPMSAVWCSRVRVRRISSNFTRSRDQSIEQCKCPRVVLFRTSVLRSLLLPLVAHPCG